MVEWMNHKCSHEKVTARDKTNSKTFQLMPEISCYKEPDTKLSQGQQGDTLLLLSLYLIHDPNGVVVKGDKIDGQIVSKSDPLFMGLSNVYYYSEVLVGAG